MPKRTTDRQKAMYLLRKAIAPEGWAVEESAELRDSVLGENREIDVLVSGRVNELDVLIGFEVVDRARAADVTWVEAMIAKHEHLPTDKLVLVSWRGFSRTARTKAASIPNVVLMQPLQVRSGVPRTMTIYADEVEFSIRDVVVEVEHPVGSRKRVLVDDLGLTLHDGTGEPLVMIGDYVPRMLEKGSIADDLMVLAHNREDREAVRYLEVGMEPTREPTAIHLLDTETDELHEIVSFTITGPFRWSQNAVDLRVETFENLVFGHGRITLNGRDGHIVVTMQDDKPVGPGAIELSAVVPGGTL